ncbi:hypothetical protein [Methylophaga thiooxydans]|uniref:hypothetical protein n=1 Tax=Methylophaga thiooxydans TaxID=392484 RepID=UPI00235537A6|nr:hypothetical protein [Methylophaga thiooxydans]
MRMKKAPAIHLVPPGHIVLSEWNIVIIKIDGIAYEKFLGLDVNTNEYRISSPVEEYDAENRIGYTASGSVYQLVDEPGSLHSKAQEVYDFMANPPEDLGKEVKVSLKFPV